MKTLVISRIVANDSHTYAVTVDGDLFLYNDEEDSWVSLVDGSIMYDVFIEVEDHSHDKHVLYSDREFAETIRSKLLKNNESRIM